MPGLYIGKQQSSSGPAEPFLVESTDLTTHGIVIGMTGSGKTGLSVCIIEELLRARIPVIVVDPKGDMANLALAFDSLAPEQFEPWIDKDEAVRSRKSVADVAAEAAGRWSRGLQEWGLSAGDVAAYASGRRVRVYTPGASAGIPLNIIDSLAWPGLEFEGNEEELRDEIDSVVSGLLGLVKVEADPISSREYILLFNLIETAWRARQDLSLEALIGQVANPPLEKVGALAVDAFYPQEDRNELMFALNNLVASPRFEAWRKGAQIDIEAWVRAPDGVPQLSIVYTAHLDDEERVFVTALLLNKLKTWMRKQPGTGDLRCLFYMDEIFGYFPPTANPPTKKPLLTLLKQARAYGLGVLLSTQNPVDLDYKGLANMGFWALGRLQTRQDQDRVREGIEAALADSDGDLEFDDLMAGVDKRIFLIHDVHRPEPELVCSRWAMSYLRGPLTREELKQLPAEMVEWRDESPAAAVNTSASKAATVSSGGKPAPLPEFASSMPPLPSPLRPMFASRFGGTAATPHLFVKAAVRYRVGGITSDEQVRELAFRLEANAQPGQVLEQEPFALFETELSESAPLGLSFAAPPSFVQADGARAFDRILAERLDDRLQIDLAYDPATRQYARIGESSEAFARRLSLAARDSSRMRTLEDRLGKKRADLAVTEQDLAGRQAEKWANLGTSILGNLGILGRRSRRGIGSVLGKTRAETTAQQRIQRLESEISALEQQVAELGAVDPGRFETRNIKPAKADVSVLRYEVVWIS